VLVATDYIGLGSEGPHPYLVGQPSGRAVLDAVRAARQLDDVRLQNQTVVWGHSQGGGAAMWTGQLAPTYAPDVNVVGVAALAPAADIPNLIDNLYELAGGSMFAAYALTGYSGAYPDVRFDDYVRPTARTVVRELAARCLGEPAVLVSVLVSITTSMAAFRRDLGSGGLGERLAENVPSGPFEMPVLIGQGGADTLVTPDVVAAYADRLCNTGAVIDYRSYDGKDHVGLVAVDSPLLPELVTWTQRRLDGDTATTTCTN
jgi:alpha-beta hydrolase superfamily lysophospholipase